MSLAAPLLGITSGSVLCWAEFGFSGLRGMVLWSWQQEPQGSLLDLCFLFFSFFHLFLLVGG